MIFETEIKRLAHPVAGLIPVNVWESVFNSELTDTQYIIASSSEAVIWHFLREEDVHCLYYCLAINPNIEALRLIAMLRHACDKFEISDAFIAFSNFGRLDLLKALDKSLVFNLQKIIEANDYAAFRGAVENAHVDVLRYFATLMSPDALQTMIAMADDYAFDLAAENNHVEVLRYLVDLIPANRLVALIVMNDYYVIREAAKKGHIDILRCLIDSISPDNLQALLEAGNYRVFRDPVRNGHVELLKYFESKAPAKLQAMIAANNYLIFSDAFRNSRLEVLRYLALKAPDKLQEMIAAIKPFDFQLMAKDGHLEVLRYLESIMSSEQFQSMIAVNIYHIAGLMTSSDATFTYLLSKSLDVLAYAEIHLYEYANKVIPFIDKALLHLESLKQAAILSVPNTVFDLVDPIETERCFYMLRNLIRRPLQDNVMHEGLRDKLLFLLSIPSVKALAHGRSNELLRLALSLGNQQAADILLNIPAVRTLARAHDYYRQEARAGIDMAALVMDPESSLTALTQGEQKRLQAAISHYQPLMNHAGIEHLMTELKAWLIAYYEVRPAKIMIEGQEVVLPYDWDDFNALNLAEGPRQEALKAYYQSSAHSAWRYLQKPNPWMHANASYVYVDPEHPVERWSTFEEYQPLIAMLSLAARDITFAPIDEHSQEGREAHFIQELAFIGRAHNWDGMRLNSKSEMEEYDDLEGDRPSCFSGVKRRLFQSVIGHPLLQILSRDDIFQEVREFVRETFKVSITLENCQTLNHALQEAFTELNDIDKPHHDILKSFNIPEAQITAFIKSLGDKYGAQFSEDASLQLEARKYLSLNQEAKSPIETNHACKFYDMINLQQLLDKSFKHPENRVGFFSSSASASSSSSELIDKPKPGYQHK